MALAISQTLSSSVNAATIVVNDNADDGGGVDNGVLCTLREAVVSINSQTLIGVSGCSNSGSEFGVDDTIIFNNSLSGPLITLTQSKELKIDNPNVDLTIDGLGQDSLTIDGNGNSRVFYVQYATVSINNLTISGGSAEHRYGGGIFALGSSNVNLTNCTVSNNSTGVNGGGGIGVIESSSVSLTNSEVSFNSATFSGGGIYISDSSSVSLTNSTVTSNSAGSLGGTGGGIAAAGSSSMSLVNSTVSNNSAITTGGIDVSYSSSASLLNSTVSNNTAGYFGGGISAYYSSSVSLLNSTVSNNTGDTGGGISLDYNSYANLSNSTVSSNSANNVGGGISAYHTSSVSLANSIISNNTATNTGAEIISNYGSAITAAHNNLFGHSGLALAEALQGFTPGVSDINATSMDDTISIHLPTAAAAILSTLANNGCTQQAGAPSSEACVQTSALVSNSPAIDAAGSHCPSTDQRGYSRNDANDSFFVPIITTGGKLAVVPLGEDECDIGSVEYQPGD